MSPYTNHIHSCMRTRECRRFLKSRRLHRLYISSNVERSDKQRIRKRKAERSLIYTSFPQNTVLPFDCTVPFGVRRNRRSDWLAVRAARSLSPITSPVLSIFSQRSVNFGVSPLISTSQHQHQQRLHHRP